MKNIEIPNPEDRGFKYRIFEILPAVGSWSLLFFPLILSFYNALWATYFIVAFVLIWFARAVAMTGRVVEGYKKVAASKDLPWTTYLEDLSDPKKSLGKYKDSKDKIEQIHAHNIEYSQTTGQKHILPSELIHVVIIAAYNESKEIIEPTVKAVIDSNYDTKKQVVLVFAYEQRGGPEIKKTCQELIKKYKGNFLHSVAYGHPNDIPHEVIGKGGNITYAGRQIQRWIAEQNYYPENVMITTLDADNRPHPNYLAALSYMFIVTPDRQYKSYQPVSIYTNNIWDVPAPMRVIGLGNSFYWMLMAMRPHLLRNFSAHAQGLKSLIDTDYWSVRTIVEDGHQFWRTYFRHDGRHDVIPLFTPIYQDAVLADTYAQSYKAQFIQLRRWTWGASDIAFVVTKGFFSKNKVPKFDLITKTARLIDGHISWATSSLILAFAGWMPLLINPNSDDFAVVHQLPVFLSRLQAVALIGILITLVLSFLVLPPLPSRYKGWRKLLIIIQWAWVPIISVVYGSMTALYSQTRLALKLYLAKFDVTVKAVKK